MSVAFCVLLDDSRGFFGDVRALLGDMRDFLGDMRDFFGDVRALLGASRDPANHKKVNWRAIEAGCFPVGPVLDYSALAE